MIKKNGHYILNVDDFNKICKHFEIKPASITVHTEPYLTYTVYNFVDIFTDAILFGFYDHDGKFRTKKTSTDFYEDSIENVLGKRSGLPPKDMLSVIHKNIYKPSSRILHKIDEVNTNHSKDD